MIDSKACSRREMFGAAALGWFALSTPSVQDPAPALRSRTIVFVRHAEKQVDDDDPELTEQGRKRAQMLAGMFAAAGVTSAYATEFKRTRQTVAPLAGKRGIEIEGYAAGDSKKFAAGLAGPGAVTGDMIFVAGHSNTVPHKVAALGGKLEGLTAKGWLEDDEYERVVIVTLCGKKGERLQAVGTVDLRSEV